MMIQSSMKTTFDPAVKPFMRMGEKTLDALPSGIPAFRSSINIESGHLRLYNNRIAFTTLFTESKGLVSHKQG